MRSNLSLLLTHFNPKEKIQLALLFLVTTINGLVQALGVVSVMPLIALIIDASLVKSNPLLMTFKEMLPVTLQGVLLPALATAVFLLLLLGNALATLDYWLTLKLCNTKEYKLSARLLNSYMHSSYLVFKGNKLSGMARNVISEVDRVMVGTLLAVVKLVSDSIISVSLLGLLVYVNLWITLCVCAVICIAYGIIYLSIDKKIETLGNQFPELEKNIFSTVKQILDLFQEIKISGRSDFFLEKYADPARAMIHNSNRYHLLQMLPYQFVEVTAFGIVIAVAVYFSNTIDSSAQIMSTLAFFAFAVYRLIPALKDMIEGIEELRFLGNSLEKLLAQFDTNTDEKQIITETETKMSAKRDILISNLSFSYDLAPNRLFSELNICIRASEFTCIAGPSGVGKSTLLYLLLGLLEPDEGEILIDGSPLTSSNMRLWQNALGYVPQHIKLTEGTLLENIAFGVPANKINKTRAVEVAIAAGIDSFITNELSDQYETVVGDGGVLLSGGQKQRIGIARSLYHNPAVLLLDESTNELDDETESRILQKLQNIEGLTIVFISHKSSVQKHADSVVFLSTPNRQRENTNSNG